MCNTIIITFIILQQYFHLLGMVHIVVEWGRLVVHKRFV